MKITEREKQDLYAKLISMADKTLKDKDFGKYSFIIDLQDGFPVKLSEVHEIKYYTRTKKRLGAANT